MKPKLISLTYISQATQDMGMLALMRLVSQAILHNKEISVTGVLFYENKRFGQTIEGGEPEILGLWEKIKQDPRHHEIKLIDIKEIADRQFSQWAMRFLGADELVKICPELREVLLELPDQKIELLKVMQVSTI